MTMSIENQFSVFLVNKPGVLAQVCQALADAKINIKALTLVDSQEHGVLRLVIEDGQRARPVLKALNVPVSETDVLCIELANRPGAMADVCKALSRTHHLDPVGLAENVYDLLRRFSCRALGDTVARVAGDPIRKLTGPGGRLIGSASLCLSHGIIPVGIIHSITLALRYDNPADDNNRADGER